MDLIWTEAGVSWEAAALAGDRFDPAGMPLSLVRRRVGGADGWVLVSTGGGEVLVNGRVVPGVRLLSHRDEVQASGGRFFFASERIAEVLPFSGETPAACPVCKLAIDPGSPAVRCPGCGVAHHQNERRACWTHRATCIVCSHSTCLDGRFRWSPETL